MSIQKKGGFWTQRMKNVFGSISIKFRLCLQFMVLRATKKLKIKLQTDQNKTCRYILDYHSTHHIGYADFCKLRQRNIVSKVNYLFLNLMYGVSNQSAPSYVIYV